MRIALVQVASPSGEAVEARRSRVGDLVRSRTPPGTDLVVLPELWAVGFCHYDDYRTRAETLQGPTVGLARELARDLGAWVHAGSFVEDRGDGTLRNTAALVSPDGGVRLSSSKVHVFGHASREADLLSPGRDVAVCTTPFGVVSTTTCFDLRFPGLWSRIADAGAEVVVVPAAWPAARLEHWRLLTTARALDTQALVVACNAAGEQAGVRQGGHSRVVDPWGVVLGEAGAGEEVLTVDVDPGVVARTRAEFPVLRERLADYGELTTTVDGEPAGPRRLGSGPW